jgi:hypothetical protein
MVDELMNKVVSMNVSVMTYLFTSVPARYSSNVELRIPWCADFQYFVFLACAAQF